MDAGHATATLPLQHRSAAHTLTPDLSNFKSISRERFPKLVFFCGARQNSFSAPVCSEREQDCPPQNQRALPEEPPALVKISADEQLTSSRLPTPELLQGDALHLLLLTCGTQGWAEAFNLRVEARAPAGHQRHPLTAPAVPGTLLQP